MKRYILLGILGVFLSWSCNSGPEKNEDQSNNQTTIADNSNTASDNQDDNTSQKEQEKPPINPEFKAFLSKFAKTSLPYKENPSGNEEFDKIPLNEQVSYLSKAEKLSEANFNDMSEYTDFYYISNPLSTDKFHVLVYGRFEMGSTYYFLCTYDNDGKLISNIDFAAYEMMSSGPMAGQEFNTNGLIDKNYEITVKSEEETRSYKISEDGKIVKL